MEVFYTVLGGFAIYASVHFCFVQHKLSWEDRSNYEKFLTIFTFVSVGMVYLGVMFG